MVDGASVHPIVTTLSLGMVSWLRTVAFPTGRVGHGNLCSSPRRDVPPPHSLVLQSAPVHRYTVYRSDVHAQISPPTKFCLPTAFEILAGPLPTYLVVTASTISFKLHLLRWWQQSLLCHTIMNKSTLGFSFGLVFRNSCWSLINCQLIQSEVAVYNIGPNGTTGQPETIWQTFRKRQIQLRVGLLLLICMRLKVKFRVSFVMNSC